MKKLLLFILLFTLIISVCGCDTFGDDTFGVLNDEPDAKGVTRVIVSTNERRGTCLISDIGFELDEIEKTRSSSRYRRALKIPTLSRYIRWRVSAERRRNPTPS